MRMRTCANRIAAQRRNEMFEMRTPAISTELLLLLLPASATQQRQQQQLLLRTPINVSTAAVMTSKASCRPASTAWTPRSLSAAAQQQLAAWQSQQHYSWVIRTKSFGTSILFGFGFYNAVQTRTATRSCRDPETAVIHFWSPGDIRCRPQRAASAAAAAAAVCRQGGSL